MGQKTPLTFGTDVLTGTSGNDTFTAATVNDGSGTLVDSLDDSDIIDGGAGTDTINVTVLGTNDPVTPVLTNIENVNVRFITAAGTTIALGSSTGVTAVAVANSGVAGEVTGVGEATLAVSNQSQAVEFNGSDADALSLTLTSVGTTADTTIDLGDAAATSATFTLAGTGSLDADGAADDVVTIAIDGTSAIADLTIAASGTNVIDLDADLDTIETLTVNGSGSVLVEGTATALTALTDLTVTGSVSVDLSAETLGALEAVVAGAATGDISVKADATLLDAAFGSGDDTLTQTAALAADTAYTLGAGDDTYVVGAATDSTTASVDAGADEDTLSMTAIFAETISADADIAAIYQNFETLNISSVMDDSGTDNDDVVDLADFDGIENIKVAAGVKAAGTATINSVANNGDVTLAGDLVTNDGALDINVTDAATTDATVNVTLNSSDLTGADNDIVLDIDDVETINLTASSTDDADTIDSDYNVALTADAIVTLNIAGDQIVDFAATADMDELETIDASANTAGVIIDVDLVDTIGVAITGTAEDDTITGSDFEDTIVGGAGNDTITGGGAADIIDGGADTDTFVATLAEQAGASTTDGVVINLGDTELTQSAVFTLTGKYLASVAPTVAAGTGTYLFSSESTTNASVVDQISNIENITGTSGVDYIVGTAGNNTITGGAGIDYLTGGAGVDSFVLNSAATANRDVVTDFTAGSGGDKLVFDISDLGLAGGTVFVGATGAIAIDSSEEILVITGAGYASVDAAEDAIAARVTTDGLDHVVVFFNTATNQVNVYHDVNAGVDGADGTATLIGVISNITTLAGLQAFVAGNVDSVA